MYESTLPILGQDSRHLSCILKQIINVSNHSTKNRVSQIIKILRAVWKEILHMDIHTAISFSK